MTSNTPTNITILRIANVLRRTGLSKSYLYEKLNSASEHYDPFFPKQIRLGASAVGWVESEVSAWIEARIAASRMPEERPKNGALHKSHLLAQSPLSKH